RGVRQPLLPRACGFPCRSAAWDPQAGASRDRRCHGHPQGRARRRNPRSHFRRRRAISADAEGAERRRPVTTHQALLVPSPPAVHFTLGPCLWTPWSGPRPPPEAPANSSSVNSTSPFWRGFVSESADNLGCCFGDFSLAIALLLSAHFQTRCRHEPARGSSGSRDTSARFEVYGETILPHAYKNA